MLDIERVAGCMPGAEVVGANEDGGYDANVKVKVGPMAMTYRGTLRIAEQDDATLRAVMLASAREIRGQGSAKARMVMHVLNGDPTTVRVETDLQVTGRVAQMGRGVMQDVANRLMQDFAANLRQMIAGQDTVQPAPAPAPAPAPPETPQPGAASIPSDRPARKGEIGAGRLAWSVLRGRLRALLHALAKLFGRGPASGR